MPTEIKNELDSTLGDSSPPLLNTKKWAGELKCGHSSTYGEHSGCPKTDTTDRNIEKLYSTMLNDQHLKMYKLAGFVNVSADRVDNMLHEHLSVKTL